MRFEFWIDYLCPITYLTHKNLVSALDELNLKNYDLFYRSYILKEDDISKVELNENYIKLIEENNLEFNYFDTNFIHQIAHLAKRRGKAKEFSQLALKEVFENKKLLDNKDDVLNLAVKAGLKEDESLNVLNTVCYTKQIASNKINALNRKIEVIPHIRINMKHHISGYITKDELIKEIKRIINNLPKTEYCGENCVCSTY